jgi:PAS domain S-box-containing protein
MTRARILVVEDEVLVSMDIAACLGALGHQALGPARTAAEAAILAENLAPDLILMDVALKGNRDGIAAALAIRENLDTPVIFLTSHGQPETVGRARSARPYGFLLKPFEPAELAAAVETALSLHPRERLLRERAARLETLLDSTGAGALCLNKESIITYANAQARSFAQVQDPVGRPVQDVFPLLDLHTGHPVHPLTLPSNAPVPVTLFRESGETLLECVRAPLPESSRDNPSSALTLRPVPLSLKEEARVRSLETAGFEALFNWVDDLLFVVSREGVLIHMNPAVEASLGFSLSELEGKSFLEVHPPEVREEAKDVWERMAAGAMRECHLPLRARDGRRIPAETRITRGLWRGGEVFFGICRDMTLRDNRERLEKLVRARTAELEAANARLSLENQERLRTEERLRKALSEKEAGEERYRRLAEAADAGVVFHENGRVLDVNSRFLDIFGLSPGEAEGQDLADLMAMPEERGRLRERILENPGEPVGALMARKDGTVFYGEYRGSVFDTGGRRMSVATLRDKTGERAEEIRRQALERRIRDAQKMEAIGTLASGIAHDFNNILYLILGYAEMAMMDLAEDSPRRQNLSHVLAATQRAQELVGRILAISQKSEDRPRPMLLQTAAQETVAILRSSLPATIEIRAALEEDLEPVNADPGQIKQVLVNLCANAFHAMEEKGGVLSLKTGREHVAESEDGQLSGLAPGAYATLTVSDTGPGIRPGLLERIFDPYFTTKPPNKGAGLGLAVARGIARKHQGEIRCESIPGKGARFTLYLPEAGRESRQNTRRGRLTVLLVDDEARIVSMTRQLLALNGATVHGFENPGGALEMFRTCPEMFDVVVTDMGMPGMDGLALAKKLLETRPDIPIVMCAEYQDLVSRQTVRRAGIRCLVFKPVTRDGLARAIQEALST